MKREMEQKSSAYGMEYLDEIQMSEYGCSCEDYYEQPGYIWEKSIGDGGDGKVQPA